jgi:hypothetical protein
MLKPGLYRHYKNNYYCLFQVAHHSETREAVAVYQCLYGDFSWWVRPLDMFTESVEVGGELIPRFQFIRELSPQELNEYIKGAAIV